MDELNNKIKSKFKLFMGLRSQEEDQKIFDKVMDLTFEEIMAYVGENLSEEDRNNFLEDMAKDQTDADKNKVFEMYLTKIKGYQVGILLRIDRFLNNLLYSSAKAAQQQA